MSVTTVETIISHRVKVTLQELSDTGTRWTNEELIGWLNESYQQIVALRPDASSINAEVSLDVGTKQTIPTDGLRLIAVVRNTAVTSNKRAVSVVSRLQLDATRPSWHGEAESINIEHYVFNDADPRHFYVYPPASTDAKLEIIYSSVPIAHSTDLASSKTDVIKLPDVYAPAIVDWILYRAFSKDAEHTANAAHASGHMSMFMQGLGQKSQTDAAVSPNAR